MPLTPNNREEHWLQGMVDGSTTLTPNKRREYWYKEIIDAQGGGGGGGGALMVGITLNIDETYTMDKTFGEIKTAITTMPVVFYIVVEDEGSIYPFYFVSLIDDGTKVINLTNENEPYIFISATDNDYPTTA